MPAWTWDRALLEYQLPDRLELLGRYVGVMLGRGRPGAEYLYDVVAEAGLGHYYVVGAGPVGSLFEFGHERPFDGTAELASGRPTARIQGQFGR